MTKIAEVKLQLVALQRLVADLEAQEVKRKRAEMESMGAEMSQVITFQSSDGINDWEESWEVWSTFEVEHDLTWAHALELEELGVVELIRVD